MLNKKQNYQHWRRFDVITIGETEKVFVPVKEDQSDSVLYTKIKYFRFYMRHFQLSLKKPTGELNLRYKYITKEMFVINLNL